MPKDPNTLKMFTFRMPKELWAFIRATSTAQAIPAGTLIINCMNDYRKKLEKSLTKN